MASTMLTVIGCIDYNLWKYFYACFVLSEKNTWFFFLPNNPKMSAGRWCGGRQRLGVWACCWCRTTGVRRHSDCCWNRRGHRHWRLILMQTLTMTFDHLLWWGRKEESIEDNGDGTGELFKPLNLQPCPNPQLWLLMVGTLPADGWQWASMYDGAAMIWTNHLKLKCENYCEDHHLSVGEGHHQCPKDTDNQVF